MQALSGGLTDAEGTLVKAHQMAQGAGKSFLLSSIYNFRGTVLWALGRTDEAHRWLQQGLEIMDEPFGTHNALDTRLLGTMVEPFEALVDVELRPAGWSKRGTWRAMPMPTAACITPSRSSCPIALPTRRVRSASASGCWRRFAVPTSASPDR